MFFLSLSLILTISLTHLGPPLLSLTHLPMSSLALFLPLYLSLFLSLSLSLTRTHTTSLSLSLYLTHKESSSYTLVYSA
jgi:hypothetical protein